jgi:hypothetical protein
MARTIGHKQIIELAKYLESQKQRLLDERPQYRLVALRATESLGFDVTEYNVRKMAKTCGMQWLPKRLYSTQSKAPKLNSARIIAQAVVKIAEALDIKLSANVHCIAKGRSIVDAENLFAEAEGGKTQ